MQRYGGSFAAALATAALRADSENLATIKRAFREMWDRYADMPETAVRDDSDGSGDDE